MDYDRENETEEERPVGKKSIMLFGKIIFKNTDGYLSSEYRPLKTLYIITTVFYAFLAAYWGYLYFKDKSLLISLNWHILAVVLLAFMESLLSYIDYL